MSIAKVDLTDMNQSCYCFPITRADVDAVMIERSGNAHMAGLLSSRPHYFASTAVFLSPDDQAAMLSQIKAMEAVIAMPQYRAEIAARSAGALDAVQSQTAGAFMGYDFHITPDGPRLIEINSNAGGAFIVSGLDIAAGKSGEGAERAITDMFASEWRLAGRTGGPQTVAILDENPPAQFHYPDMLLAKAALERAGLRVIIADPADLSYDQGALTCGGQAIDLVYNRLTDFTLTEPANQTLRRALGDDAVVVTPAPHHHALYADKRNLTLLTDADKLRTWDVSERRRAALSRLPKTIAVTADNADDLWAARKGYFFKPDAGFGSRGTYRGAKLTKKVWSHISAGGYIAQSYIIPPLRAVTTDAGQTQLKFDVRVYTYAGKPLLYAARVYQGQTTNLRTEGGGLAPVLLGGDGCEA